MRRFLLLLFGVFACGLVWAHSAHRLEPKNYPPHAQLPGLLFSSRTLAPREVAHGVPVVTVTVVNELPVTRTLRVFVTGGEGSAERWMTVSPSASASVDFVVPSGADYYRTLNVFAQEAGSSDGVRAVGSVASDFYYGSSQVNVLTGPSVDGIATAADYSHEDEQAKAKSHAHDKSFKFYSQTSGETGWSADARAYSAYDLILLSAAEWAAVPPAARRAIVGSVVQGGVLILCGATTWPTEAIGFPCGAEVVSDAALRTAKVGLGRLVLAPAIGEGRRPPLSRTALCNLATGAKTRLERTFAEGSSQSSLAEALPALDVPTFPVSLFVILLSVFALGVVPTVLVLCIRRQRRLTALVVLPLVSAAIGLVVVVVVLAVYGVTPSLSQASLVLLNAADRRALVSSRSCLFSPVDVTDRLRFAREALVRVVRGERRHNRSHSGGSSDLCLVSGETQSARGRGWMKTLLPVVYATAEMRDTNARLVVEEVAADRVKVTNLLGGPVTRFVVTDSRGRVFWGTDLPEGATRELTGTAEAPVVTAKDSVFVWSGDEAMACDLGSSLSAPTSYRAELATCPFLTDTLGGTSAKRHERTTVFGRYGKGVAE